MSDERTGRLRRVGVLWKPKPGARSLGSGRVTINNLRQRFVVMRNERKRDGSNEPDYLLLSSDAPEVDEYARGHQSAPSPGDAPVSKGLATIPKVGNFSQSDKFTKLQLAVAAPIPFEATRDDIPF